MWMGLIPLFGTLLASYIKSTQKQEPPADLTTPSAASTQVITNQQEERRKATVRKGRRSTNITGGLSDNPSLGSASLWGIG